MDLKRIAHDVAVESGMAHESLSALTAVIQEGIDRAFAARGADVRELNVALHGAAEGLDMAMAMIEQSSYLPDWDHLRSIRVRVKCALLPLTESTDG